MDGQVADDSNICNLQNDDMSTMQKENELCNVTELSLCEEAVDGMTWNETLSPSQLKSETPELQNCSVTPETPAFVCHKCQRTFKQKSRYERHISNHPSEKHYLCTTCQKTFTRMSHLEKHIRTHTEERRHVCNICGAAFILPHHLVRHNMVHTGVRPFQCQTCHKQFTRKAGLAQHEFVHTGIRPFVCEVKSCEKLFTDRSTLRRHLLTHSREKPFLCKECKKTFRTKSACRKHYLRHFKGLDSFKCGICEEMFVNTELLEKHGLIHEDKQKLGVLSYRCGFCLRVFITQSDLDAHVPLHQSGMKHSCEECSAKFYTEHDLVIHMETHSGKIQPLYDGSPEENTFDNNITMIENKCENVGLPDTSALLNEPNTSAANCSKVVVVLQLPPSAIDGVKGALGNFGRGNLQQLIGNAQIDKLLVTTDPIANSSSTLALHLSQDQQEGIQQILQSTSINSVEFLRSDDELNPIPNINQCSLHEEINDINTNNNINTTGLAPLELSFTMKETADVSVRQPEELQSDKQGSAFIIVPTYEQNGGSDISFTSHDDYKAMIRNDDLNIRKLGGESVFLSNKNILQQVIMSSGDVKHDINNNNITHSLVTSDDVNTISTFQNHSILYWPEQDRN